MLDTTIGNTSHVTIESQIGDRTIDDWQGLLATIREKGQVTAITPSISLPAFTVDGDRFQSVLVRGLEFPAANGIFGVLDRIVKGEQAAGQILIGKDLALEIGVDVGETLTLLTGAGQRANAPISGVFDLQVAALNKTWIITDLERAQDVFQLGDGITSIEMQIGDVFMAQDVALSLAPLLREGLMVTNWKDQNQQLLSGLQGQSTSSLMIQIFVVIAVALGIASVLVVTAIQKSRQIGILKAMGIKDRHASMVFLFQGLVLGAIGGALGILLGLGLTFAFSRLALNPDGSPIVEVVILPSFLLVSMLIALGAAMIAAIVPARRSKNLEPMEVIRNG